MTVLTQVIFLLLVQAPSVRLFIEAKPQDPTVNVRDARLPSASELIEKVQKICKNCTIAMSRETATFAATFEARNSVGTSNWSWTLYNVPTDTLIKQGKTAKIDNSVKDMIDALPGAEKRK